MIYPPYRRMKEAHQDVPFASPFQKCAEEKMLQTVLVLGERIAIQSGARHEAFEILAPKFHRLLCLERRSICLDSGQRR